MNNHRSIKCFKATSKTETLNSSTSAMCDWQAHSDDQPGSPPESPAPLPHSTFDPLVRTYVYGIHTHTHAHTHTHVLKPRGSINSCSCLAKRAHVTLNQEQNGREPHLAHSRTAPHEANGTISGIRGTLSWRVCSNTRRLPLSIRFGSFASSLDSPFCWSHALSRS